MNAHRWSALGLMLLLSGCIFVSNPPAGESPATSHWDVGPALSPQLVGTLGEPKSSGIASGMRIFDNSPKVVDFNGDGRMEIVAHSNDTKVYVFSYSGRVLASLKTTYPPSWHLERVLNGVAVDRLRPQEPPTIVVTNHAAYVSAWTFKPDASKDDAFVFEKKWERRMDECHRRPGMDAAATIADLDGDGIKEILVQTEEIGFYALRADGSTLWKKCWAGGNGAITVGSLYGDARVQAIVASDSGFLSVLDGPTGEPLWTFDAGKHASPGSISVQPTIAELDGALPREILFTARSATGETLDDYRDNHFTIFAVRQNLQSWEPELVWKRSPAWANPMSNTRLIVFEDQLGVGIVGMDWNTIGHLPGDWERLGPAHVFRLDALGNDVWVRELDTWWSNMDIAVMDIDADGAWEVVATGPGATGDGLWRLSLDSGRAEGFIGTSPWKVLRGPVFCPLHNGERTLAVLPVQSDDGHDRGALVMYEFPVRFNAPSGSAQC